jgi:anaerobic ribonucleoside-triphosphate reductase activating protein
MYVARLLYPVKVLGPGNRVGIWFNGCTHFCKGCSNPELWELQNRYKVSLENVIKLIERITEHHKVDGFTITGGDPFEQAEDLEKLVNYLSTITQDIIIYSGYKFDYLNDKHHSILEKIAVLIDGEYIEEKNENCFMKGSTNQNIIVLNQSYKDMYDNYLINGENEIQNFTTTDGVISVGIHRRGYEQELNDLMNKMGLEETNNG